MSPTISNGSYLLTSDEYTNLYVIDPANKRIVIYDKNGILLRQVIVDVAQEFADATVSPAEDKAYILDGTRVLAVSLVE